MEEVLKEKALGGRQSDRMGVEPEGRLLFSLSIPMVISMTMQALYNIVDSVFVSRISEDALTAVSLAFPMQMLMVALAVGTGVGISSLISRRLGARRFDEADLAAGNGITLMFLSAVVFCLFGIFGAQPFIRAFTDDAGIAGMGGTYLSICCTWCFGVFLQMAGERVMQAQGKPMFSMIMQLVGAVVNIILDPIMIFGLLGCPALGIAGAAIATVIGQFTGCLLSFIILFSKKNELKLRLRHLLPDAPTVKNIYQVGVPSILMQSIGTAMNLVMNAVLIAFSSTAVAVFGVYFKLQSFVFMPVFGVTGAAMSIMAYNFGARKKDRLMRTFKLTVGTTVITMAVGAAVFVLFPQALLSLFDASPAMLKIGVPALRILGAVFPVAAYCISNSVLFQAVGNGVYSMLMSFVRQMLVLVPAALILAKVTNDVSAVWWAFPIAEISAVILATIFFSRLYKTKIAPLDEPAA